MPDKNAENERRMSGKDINELNSLFCSQIPKQYLNMECLDIHFSKFGKLNGISIYPSLNGCIIQYEKHECAALAKKEGNILNNHKLLILWNLPQVMMISGLSSKKEIKKNDSQERTKLTEDINSESKTDYETHDKSDSLIKIEKKKSKRSFKEKEMEILQQKATNNKQRYDILNMRDKLLRSRIKLIKNLALTKKNKGICTDMCPEKERYRREFEQQFSIYEQGDQPGTINHHTAIKAYSRSSADQAEPLPYELRPTPVLRMTMDYILEYIIEKCENPGENLIEWYHFIWDRTRAIRKDITQQELCDENVVTLIEQCARFHIFCSERLIEEDYSVYDDKINTENLTKCLQTLKYIYSDLFKKGKKCSNEAEFRAYMIYLNMNNGNCLSELQNMSEDIRKSHEVTYAIKIFLSLNTNNYVKFFSLVKSSPYLIICIVRRYFLQMRYQAINIIVKSYTLTKRPIQIRIEYLNSLLGFSATNQALLFYKHLNLKVTDGFLTLSKSYEPPNTAFPQKRAYDFITKTHSLKEIIAGGPIDSSAFKRHTPHFSFTSEGVLDKLSLGMKDQVDKKNLYLNKNKTTKNVKTANKITEKNDATATGLKKKSSEFFVKNQSEGTNINQPLSIAETRLSSSLDTKLGKRDASFTNDKVSLSLHPIKKTQDSATSPVRFPSTPISQKPFLGPEILSNTENLKTQFTEIIPDNFKFDIRDKTKLKSPQKKEEGLDLENKTKNFMSQKQETSKERILSEVVPLQSDIKNIKEEIMKKDNKMKKESHLVSSQIPTTKTFPHYEASTKMLDINSPPFKGSKANVNIKRRVEQREGTQQTLKDKRRKTYMEELNEFSLKELENITDFVIKDFLYHIVEDIFKVEEERQAEFVREKKLEEIKKKIQSYKIRIFFTKWKKYTVCMREIRMQESFPAWIAVNDPEKIVKNTCLHFRKDDLILEQSKDNQAQYKIFDFIKTYRILKQRLLKFSSNLPNRIEWKVLLNFPNNNQDCIKVFKSWLRHMFSSTNHQSSIFKSETLQIGTLYLNITIKEYEENIEENQNDQNKIPIRNYIFFYNTNLESLYQAAQRFKRLMYTKDSTDRIIFTFIINGHNFYYEEFILALDLHTLKDNSNFLFKISYDLHLNYSHLHEKMNSSLNYLADNWSLDFPFHSVNLSEFLERIFFSELSKVFNIEPFKEVASTDINYLIKIYNSLLSSFLSNIRSHNFIFITMDIEEYKKQFLFKKNPEILVNVSQIALLEKISKECNLKYFCKWPPQNFVEFRKLIKNYCSHNDSSICQNILRYIYLRVEDDNLETFHWDQLSIPLKDILFVFIENKIKYLSKKIPSSTMVYKKESIDTFFRNFIREELSLFYNDPIYKILNKPEEMIQDEKEDLANVELKLENDFSLAEMRSLYESIYNWK